MAKAGATADDLAAIGITNQRETTLVWDPTTGLPLTRAVVWMDTRAASICKHLASALGSRDALADRTGLPIVPYFSGPKLKWLLDHTKGLSEKANSGRAVFGTIDTWLAWCLTGGPGKGLHITDVTNASRTLMLDLNTLQWAEDLCAHFDVPLSMLPKVVSSSERYGTCDPWTGLSLSSEEAGGVSSAATGSGSMPPVSDESVSRGASCLFGVPLAGILGDQQAALFG